MVCFLYTCSLYSFLGQVLSHGGLEKSNFVHIYKKCNTNLCDSLIIDRYHNHPLFIKYTPTFFVEVEYFNNNNRQGFPMHIQL